jgi:polyhydroxyalkanoate synthesis regulator phasin
MTNEDGWRRYIEAGVALMQITRARAEELVRELAKTGEIERWRAQERVDDLVAASRAASEAFVAAVRSELQSQVRDIGAGTIEELAGRVADILGAAGAAGRAVTRRQPVPRRSAASAAKRQTAKRATQADDATTRASAAKRATKRVTGTRKAAGKAASTRKAATNKATGTRKAAGTAASTRKAAGTRKAATNKATGTRKAAATRAPARKAATNKATGTRKAAATRAPARKAAPSNPTTTRKAPARKSGATKAGGARKAVGRPRSSS